MPRMRPQVRRRSPRTTTRVDVGLVLAIGGAGAVWGISNDPDVVTKDEGLTLVELLVGGLLLLVLAAVLFGRLG